MRSMAGVQFEGLWLDFESSLSPEKPLSIWQEKDRLRSVFWSLKGFEAFGHARGGGLQ